MVIRSGLFNSVRDVNGIGDRRYDALWFAEYFATFIGNGVFPNPSNGLQVVEGENMTTVVKAGKAWINGYFVTNDSDHILDHDNADGVLQRVDRIVARLNFVEREIEIVVKKGTFASNPAAPILQRDGDAYELALADVLITNGATQIMQGHITDTRLNNELCGIVHGLVNQVDTTTIFNQYMAWFNGVKNGTEQEIEAWQQKQYEEFEIWFDSIKDILDGDVAANLASRIASLENRVTNHLADYNVGKLKWDDTSNVVTALKTVKSNKDAEGIFTTVSSYRKSDDTLYQQSLLSGGTSPKYTTRTVTTFDADGTTVLQTDVYALSYDDEGTLISEV